MGAGGELGLSLGWQLTPALVVSHGRAYFLLHHLDVHGNDLFQGRHELLFGQVVAVLLELARSLVRRNVDQVVLEVGDEHFIVEGDDVGHLAFVDHHFVYDLLA